MVRARWWQTIVAVPTWAMTNALTPFLSKSHPWRGRWFPLADWHRYRTDETRFYDFALWWWFFSLCLVVLSRYVRSL